MEVGIGNLNGFNVLAVLYVYVITWLCGIDDDVMGSGWSENGDSVVLW